MLSTPSLRPYSVTGTFAPVTQRPSRPASHGILTFTRAPPKFHLVICLSYKQRSSVVVVFVGKSTTETQSSPRSHRGLGLFRQTLKELRRFRDQPKATEPLHGSVFYQ